MRLAVIPDSNDYLSAREAVQLLGVRMQTLYAYVSRGWVRSVSQQGQKERLYARADIERVKARSQARAGHGAVAASAMHWGEPIIPTSITQITPEGPRYRGYCATRLAYSAVPFENVADLLWSGELDTTPSRWQLHALPRRLEGFAATMTSLRARDQLLELFTLFTVQLGLAHAGAPTADEDSTLAARALIKTLAGCFGYTSAHGAFYRLRKGQPVAEGMLEALGVEPDTRNLLDLNAALVVLADHELSPSAFAARIAASGGASLHNCIAAAMCANSGTHVGRQYSKVEQALKAGASRATLFRRASELQSRRLAVPGFGHPLYPQGDPRARLLLDRIRERPARSRRLDVLEGFVADVQDRLGLQPSQELAMVMLGIAMGLPAHTAGGLFTLARTAGWVAHIREQRQSGALLRPRAKFIGV